MTLNINLQKGLTALSALIIIALLGISKPAIAGEGDTTWVQAHDNVDITWWGSYDQWASFPPQTVDYSRILCYFTLGCASGGCSDWDYTVQLTLVDTNTNEQYELGRAITPYGGYMANSQEGFNNSWERTFVYDVTDFASLFDGDQLIRTFYGGWSSGFSSTIQFAFIEGTPVRDVQDIHVLYRSGPGGWGYSTGTTFDTANLKPLTVDLGSASNARLRVTPSGHGFDNNVACAEFCERDYWFDIDGTETFRQSMWRDDCGFNPVYPQAGTWLYDRANWCPGSEAWTYFHELTGLSGGDMTFDMNITEYGWTGSQTPNYIIDAQLITYGDFNIQVDAEIADIVRPSNAYRHSRVNPSCSKPEVIIRNNGGETLTSAMITYGVEGGQVCYHLWEGSLEYGESEKVVLGNINWAGLNPDNPVFYARISDPNSGLDEIFWNNEMRTGFDLPPHYETEEVEVYFRTNGAPSENVWYLKDDVGNTIAAELFFDDAFTIYSEIVTVEEGCYVFQMLDSDKDGLEFFANGDGNGLLRLINTLSGAWEENFQTNFGTMIHHEFTTMLPLGQVKAAEDACDITGLEEVPADYTGVVYPNPASTEVMLQLPLDADRALLKDLQGRLLWQQSGQGTMNLDVSDLPAGVYLINFQAEERILERHKLVVR